ncbi:MAG: hypothetical protein NT169_11685 [Chloroflexi bacterium]|nr:hypothetical protein [Chloroflexota bacterium]
MVARTQWDDGGGASGERLDHEGAKMAKDAKHEAHEESRRAECLRDFVIQTPFANAPSSASWSLLRTDVIIRSAVPRRRKSDMPILKLEQDDENKQLEFELAYQRTLTTQERFELMLRKSREIAEVLLKHGYRKPVEIVKRT